MASCADKLTCSLQVAAERWFQFFKYQGWIEMADWKGQKWGAWCQLIQWISRQLLSVLASTWDTSKAELLHCAVMFKLNLMKWLWSNSGTFWHIERLCYDRTMVINYLHLTHKDITTSQCKMYNLAMIFGCCRCEQAMFEQCYGTIFIVTCLLFETIFLRIGWWGTSCQSSADKLQSAPFFWRQRFFETFQTCFPDCFLHQPSQVSFHTESEIFLYWRVTLMDKKAQNMSHPHKRISQNMPGQISKEEGESGNYIFFELEDRIRIAMGIIFGLEGGGEEWQSGSQRANVHSYSAHNETCPSSKIAFDARCSPGLRR